MLFTVPQVIEFFVAAHTYSLPGSQTGVESILHLVWSKESGIRQKYIKFNYIEHQFIESVYSH